MFALRYHVASLAAVFLALIIGIVVGVGISGKGFVQNSERRLLNEQIADLKSPLDSGTTPRRARVRRARVSDADERTALGDEHRARVRRPCRPARPVAGRADPERRRYR